MVNVDLTPLRNNVEQPLMEKFVGIIGGVLEDSIAMDQQVSEDWTTTA